MVDQELQFYVNYGFFTISLEIRNRATLCCFRVLGEKCFVEILNSFAGYCYLCCNHNVKVKRFSITVAPINKLKLNIISMLTFPEICYYAISDLFNAVQRLQGRVQL
ncbi:hypothetical protein T12_12407 [Trichinella patagoniensis]|uniref:Uncharacterized protein n=1 Tax=Trichinella patagoniensis TaxID=990121 RepID=A0A0V0Z550_9BILA|nr:hypothetical protein T12_12407 [Trichinella patagoniensis]